MSMPLSEVGAPGAGMSRRTSALRERIMNGPLPTGSSAKRGAGGGASTASLGTIPNDGDPRTAANDESG
jgi:hypothetical protein